MCVFAIPIGWSNVDYARACDDPADVNCDGWINAGDIGIIASRINFGQSQPSNPRADVDGDGFVNAFDIGLVANRMHCSNNSSPSADAGANQSASVDEPVTFDASASGDLDGALVDFQWDFGDGSEGNGEIIEHSYALPGIYDVELIVTDACGETATSSATVDVQGEQGLSANFVVDNNPADLKTPLSFRALAPEGMVIAFLWSFGDGSTGYGAQVTHAYDNAGTYPVELTVIANDGSVLVNSDEVTINAGLTLLSVAAGSAVNMPRGFAVVGDVVWSAGDVQSIATANVGDVMAPAVSNSASLYGAPWHLDANESVVAVAAAWNGLYLFDATRPNYLWPMGHLDTYALDGSYTYQVAIQGDYVFAACDDAMKVIDISDPAHPVQVGAWESDGVIGQVDLIGDRAYVYDAILGGYHILDVSSPTSPVEVASFATRDTPTDTAVEGNLLAVAVGREGVQFFDITDIDAPVELSYRDYTGEGAMGVALHGTHAYVANGSRIDDLNIADPANPWLIQKVGTGLLTYRLEYRGDFLYASLAQRVVAILEP
ncbi:MAG: PKD domain-containing protein [Phycisphaerales bacterium]|nr:PKD domain-containing protein [Phycisphaerales bacterium]